MTDFSTECRYRVYNDSCGDYVEVRPDAYSRTFVEIGSSEVEDRIVMIPAQACQVAYAMLRMAEELEPTVKSNQDGGTMLFQYCARPELSYEDALALHEEKCSRKVSA